MSAIWIESDELLTAPVDVLPTATAFADGVTSSVFHVEIVDVTPSGLTGQSLMIGVESASPLNYAPQIDGITGFDYPDEPLAAFMFWDAPIDNEEPAPPIPAPTGVDSCVAAGVVKVFWDEVVWPTLDGYNIYRKESTAPDYDFGTPLNSVLLTDTEYLDTDVAMDGTSYDYVVKAVDTDTSESAPSAEISVTPVYITPTGFTDMDNPDGEVGPYNTSDFVNTHINPDGTCFLVYGLPPRFFRFDISDPSNYDYVYLGTYAYGYWADVAADSQGNAHVVWNNWYNTPKTYYYAMVTPSNSVLHFTTIHSFSGAGNNPGEVSITVTPDDEVHIVMSSYDGAHNVAYVHGQPGSLSSPTVLTYQVYSSIYHMRPDITSDRFGNVHVAWTGPSGVINYLKRDTTGTWGSVEAVSSGISGFDNWADIVTDFQGVVHIAWHISSAVYSPGYANNRTGSWQGFAISSMPSGNNVGIACDPDGNVFIDTWTGSGGDRRVRVALIDRSNNVIEISAVNDDIPYDGSWCSMAGQTDPCFDYTASVMAMWRDFPPSPGAKYARLQLDY